MKNMKNNPSARSARTPAKKIHISQGGRDLTAQAGLIPVVKFFQEHGIASKIEQTADHQRGATGLYDVVDLVILSVIGIVGGARSIRGLVTVWNDSVLSRAAGWLRIPDETTFGRILRTFTQRNINEMESLNHRIRAGIWRKVLQSGTSNVGVSACLVIDVDSTVKTACGKQQGVSVGYDPHKRGAASYHPLLAFCAETKEILQGGFVMGVPIPAMESLNSCGNFSLTFRIGLALCFVETAGFLWEICWISSTNEAKAI